MVILTKLWYNLFLRTIWERPKQMAKAKTSTSTENKIKLKCLDSKKFIDFLNKFKSFDNSMLIEFQGTDKIEIRAYNSSRSAVKIGSVEFSDVFQIESGEISDSLRLSLYNFDKIKSTFDIVNEADLNFIFEFVNIQGVDFVNKFTITSKSVKLNIMCGEISLITYLPQTTVDKLFDVSDAKIKFELPKNLLDKLLSLSTLDLIDYIDIDSQVKGDKSALMFSGKNYQMKYQGDLEIQDNFSLSVQKDYLKYMCKDDYTCYGTNLAGGDGSEIPAMVLHSNETNFKIILSSFLKDGE